MADVGSTPTPGSNRPPAAYELVSYALYLKREGYREATIKRHLKALKHLPLSSPDLTKQKLASSSLTEGVKELTCYALAKYYKFKNIPFSKPIYRRVEKIPFLPTSEEAVDLISGLKRQCKTFCQFLKET